MTQTDLDLLVNAFRQRFEARIDSEEVAPGCFRIAVISPKFVGLPHLTRHYELWDIVKAVMPRDVRGDISLILAFPPDEIEFEPVS